MTKPSQFVYVTYIASTVEAVFNALTDPEMTRNYWGRHHNASDWKIGSRWEHRDFVDSSKVDVVGTVVENDPPKRLVVTWVQPTFEGQAAKTSRVIYEVGTLGPLVKLTVTHTDLEPGSEMEESVSFGWPIVVSSLKTLLETGKPMEGMTKRWGDPI